MTLVSIEEAEATRRSWREDVQWNIARRDEAFRIADSILGEDLGNSLAGLYFDYMNAIGSGVDARWSKYHKEVCQLAEQNKGSLPALRKLWKALEELPPKPKHLTGWGNAGASFQRVISNLMRAVFAAEMGLQLTRHVRRERGWPRKLIESPGVQGVDHDFTMVPHRARRGRVELYGWEPYWPPSDGGAGLQAAADALGLKCAILPKELGMWFPGRTVPVLFYQRQGSYRPKIEAAIERMVQELHRLS
jgi:hypothetical protein